MWGRPRDTRLRAAILLLESAALGCGPREVVVGVVVPLTGAHEAYRHAVRQPPGPKPSLVPRRLDSRDVDVQAFPRIWVLRNAEANRQERAAALEESERRERIQQHLRELEERQRER